MSRKSLSASLFVIGMTLGAFDGIACAMPPQSSEGSRAASDGYVAALKDLHEHLGQVYPCFALKGIDWDRVGRDLLPRAAEVHTEKDFGLLVQELVARLEDTHAMVLPGTARPPDPDLPRWEPGTACLIDDRGRPVVYAVWPRSPAGRVGIRPGMTVVSVNGVPAEEALRRMMVRLRKSFGFSSDRALRYAAVRSLLCQERSGAGVKLELESSDGRGLGVSVTADLGPRYLPRLPVPRKGIADSADVSWTMLDDRIGYIYVRRIRQGLEGSLDKAVEALKDARGLILDVRGNSGGGFDASTAFRNFDRSPGNTAGPDRPRFAGPIAMLIDEGCVSAGEGWASWFIANKRARFFGTATAGASSRKETYTLKNGLYKVVIPVKAYTGSLDRPIERRGLEPDVEVRCNAGDLAQGKDTVVEAAIAWLEKTQVAR